MIKFDKPQNLNGSELIDELKAVGIIINAETSPFIDGNGNFWLDISKADKAKAEPIVAAHNGTTTVLEILAQRQAILDRLGLSQEEANILLGGN